MENLPSFTEPSVTFYQSWSDYLTPYPRLFMQIAQWFLYGVSIILYSLGKAVQTAYLKTFEFFSFGGIFLSPNDPTYQGWGLGKIMSLFLYAGITALTLYMGFKMLQLMWTGGRKGREFPKGVVLTLALLVFIGPLWGIISRTAPQITQDLLNSNNQSIQTKLWANNSTNLYDLANHNFDASSVKDSRSSITDEDIRGPLYKSLMSDGDYQKKLGESKYQPFEYKLSADNTVQKTTGSKLIGGDLFRDEYPVMKVNWLGIILGEVIFIVVTFFAIIKVVKAIYVLAFYIGSSVYFGLRDGTEGKRVQEILKSIEGEVTAIILSPISLIFFFAWIDFAFQLLNNWNLDTMTFAILSIGILLGGLAGLDKGFSLIEGWTGTTTKSNPMANLMGAQMAARGLGSLTRGISSGVRKSVNGGKKVFGNGKSSVNAHGENQNNDKGQQQVPNNEKPAEDSTSKKNRGTSLANAAGKVVGASSNPLGTARSAGKAGKEATLNAARSGKDAAVNKAKGMAKNVQLYGQNLKSNYQQGQQKAQDFANPNWNNTGEEVNPEESNQPNVNNAGGNPNSGNQPQSPNVGNQQLRPNVNNIGGDLNSGSQPQSPNVWNQQPRPNVNNTGWDLNSASQPQSPNVGNQQPRPNVNNTGGDLNSASQPQSPNVANQEPRSNVNNTGGNPNSGSQPQSPNVGNQQPRPNVNNTGGDLNSGSQPQSPNVGNQQPRPNVNNTGGNPNSASQPQSPNVGNQETRSNVNNTGGNPNSGSQPQSPNVGNQQPRSNVNNTGGDLNSGSQPQSPNVGNQETHSNVNNTGGNPNSGSQPQSPNLRTNPTTVNDYHQTKKSQSTAPVQNDYGGSKPQISQPIDRSAVHAQITDDKQSRQGKSQKEQDVNFIKTIFNNKDKS